LHVPGKSTAWRGGLGEKTTLVASARTWDGARLLVAAMVVGLIVLLVFAVFFAARRARTRR
jgi:hypothetical protein